MNRDNRPFRTCFGRCITSWWWGAAAALAVLLGVSETVFAAGGTTFPILMEQLEPRALALGGATVSDRGWASGAVLNPAAAAGTPRSAAADYADHPLDLWSGLVSYAQPYRSGLTLGGYLAAFDYGEFQRTGVGNGEVGGGFGASEQVMAAFVAGEPLRRLAVGGAAKFIWGDLDDRSATALAVDLGAACSLDWQQLRLGLSLRNLGRQLSSYGRDKYPLPTELLVGISRKLEHLPLTLHLVGAFTRTLEGTWQADYLPGKPGVSAGLGGEFAVPTGEGEAPFLLRIGWRSISRGLNVGHNLDTLSGFSFGAGIPFRTFRMDYAYTSMGALGGQHRFGVSGWF